MWCSCDICQTEENNYYTAYKNIKTLNENIINNINIPGNVYLIKVNSIPKYCEIIKNYLKENLENSEIKELKEKLNKYELENTIKIYDDYQDCLNIAKNDNNDNQILIVNSDFINNMKIDHIKNVKFEKINENKIKVEFSSPNGHLLLQKTSDGFYKFIEVRKKTDPFNPSTIVIA